MKAKVRHSLYYFGLAISFSITSAYSQMFIENPKDPRGGNVVVSHFVEVNRQTYDYAPSIMMDKDGKYKMWYCGGLAGDFIFYSESSSLSSGWSEPRSIFGPNTATAGAFDASHTCDPSVIRVNGTYYMYYGGIWEEYPKDTKLTRIGIATSSDGETWSRAFNSKPIVKPYYDYCKLPDRKKQELQEKEDQLEKYMYGAGQPSVVYFDGYFYMTYTDSTGWLKNGENVYTRGTGQYVLRSRDPLFQKDVETLKKNGFVMRDLNCTTGNATSYKLEGISVDWMYSNLINSFIVVSGVENLDEKSHDSKLLIYQLTSSLAMKDLLSFTLENIAVEGSGLVRQPNGYALEVTSESDNAKLIPIELFSPVGTIDLPDTWDIAYKGYDIKLITNPQVSANISPNSLKQIANYLLINQ